MAVWLVNSVKDDVSRAKSYGELRTINTRYVYGDEIEDMRIPAEVIRKMIEAADAFNPHTDFLLIAGDHLQLLAFTAMLAARYMDFKVLRYDRIAQGYIPVKLEPDESVP